MPNGQLLSIGYGVIGTQGATGYTGFTGYTGDVTPYAITSKAISYTILATDDVILASGTITITLPTAVGRTGKTFIIKNIDTGVVTVDTTSSETIDGNLTATLAENIVLTVVSDGSNWYEL